MLKYLKYILKKLTLPYLYKQYVFSNAIIQKDITNTFTTRGCNANITDLKKRFYHLMLYYPEFAFIFYWRIRVNPLNSKWLFVKEYQCKIFGSSKIEGGLMCYHPFATVINAKSIGNNFQFRNGLTIGNKNNNNKMLPVIGNNVTVGPNVVIIGDITIGNNVIIGAGAVVVKDVPSNVVIAGNPAKVIKEL